MSVLSVKASDENLNTVIAFVDEILEQNGCSMKVQMQLDVAVEEIFINIAHYAYTPNVGDADIVCEVKHGVVSVTFRDSGVPYDPLKKPDPDITLSAEERQIGGLGIFMVKKSMDEVFYEYKDGQNIFTIKKKI